MTTPTIDFVMPYGVTVEGDGSWYPKIVGDHPKKVTSAGVSLPAGPCRVAFSWDGEQSAELVLVNGDNVKRPARLEAKRGGGTLNDDFNRFQRPVCGAQTDIVRYGCACRDCRGQGAKGQSDGDLVARWCTPNRDRLCRGALVFNLRKQCQTLRRVGATQKPDGANSPRQAEVSEGIHLDREPGGARACRTDDLPATRRVALVGVAA